MKGAKGRRRSKLTQRIEGLETELKNTDGPSKRLFQELLRIEKIVTWAGHGGSFTGDNAYSILYSQEIYSCLKKREYKKRKDGTVVVVGNDIAMQRFKSLALLVKKELILTCKTRPLCVHKIKKFETLNASVARESPLLFPDHVLLSDHFRTHLSQQLNLKGDLLAAERGTERMNQNMIRIMNDVKRIKSTKGQAEKIQETLMINKTGERIEKLHKKKPFPL